MSKVMCPAVQALPESNKLADNNVEKKCLCKKYKKNEEKKTKDDDWIENTKYRSSCVSLRWSFHFKTVE